MFRYVLTAALALSATPAFANDSIAELGTGGLILSRSDAVAMESEDLYISPEKVTVDYVFRNNTDKDVDAIVAFPMPDIEGDPNEMPAIPDGQSDNFLGFEVTIDGVPAEPQLEQKAFALGIDISADLKAQNVPLYPFGDAARAMAGDPVVLADGIGQAVRAHIVTKQEFAGYWEYLLDEAIFTAPAHPSWGGAALIGQDGRLLGIGSLRLQMSRAGEIADINMVVPIDLLPPILDDLLTRGQVAKPPRPWLGAF
ncbi:MAG: DUF4424 domain-containing protein, partial [Mesorhizobium sp.]